MDKKTVDIYIAGSHFKINHEDPEYVKRVAAIVEEKIDLLQEENNAANIKENILLVCLDLCDDMLTARAERNEALARTEALDLKISELTAQTEHLKREIADMKKPKFIIPAPIGKSKSDVSAGQLCFPPFEKHSNLAPAVNGLTVANIRKSTNKNNGGKAENA